MDIENEATELADICESVSSRETAVLSDKELHTHYYEAWET